MEIKSYWQQWLLLKTKVRLPVKKKSIQMYIMKPTKLQIGVKNGGEKPRPTFTSRSLAY
jgi:hypothetical protein